MFVYSRLYAPFWEETKGNWRKLAGKLKRSFLGVRKLGEKLLDSVHMKRQNGELIELRERFDLVVKQKGIRTQTAVRYRSWIRRYLKHCQSLGLSPDQKCAMDFLKLYSSYNSQRQGYYALKFFFRQVVRDPKFIDRSTLLPSPRMPSQKRKWWFWKLN